MIDLWTTRVAGWGLWTTGSPIRAFGGFGRMLCPATCVSRVDFACQRLPLINGVTPSGGPEGCGPRKGVTRPAGSGGGQAPGHWVTRPIASTEPRATRRARDQEVQPAMAVVTMRQLLDSGVHFGHQTRRWNPKMKRFIFTERNGIYIIDLQQTLSYIDRAYEFVRETVA